MADKELPNENLFQGDLVRLAVDDAQTIAEAYSRWSRDSEYWRLLDSDPAYPRPVKTAREWVEKAREKDPPESFLFSIRTLADDRLIGEIGLDGVKWSQGETFVGIGVGERDFWGKGYGTDAMRVIIRFAFRELNLQRVSLDVFEYNPRAIRSYEKAGFVHEGRMKGFLFRDGQRYDLLFMGILRDEWLAKNLPDRMKGV